MFEKLGYTRKVDSEKLIYTKYLNGKFLCLEITFDLMEKEIEWFDCYEDYTISNALLLAICKQAKELGWIEEEKQEKQETNYEYFKDEIIENSGYTFALVDGKPCSCSGVMCCDCGFSTGHGCGEKIKEWLNKPHEKQTYKLSQFEYDLLQNYNGRLRFIDMNTLYCMKEKGYFKGIDENETVGDILANCEVIK